MLKMEKPFVCLVSEISVDGKLTLGKGISSKIFMTLMGHEAEVFLHELRANYDAIMVGSNTIKIDNSNLTVRYAKGKIRLGLYRALMEKYLWNQIF